MSQGACHDHWMSLVWASAVTVKSDKEEGLASLVELVVPRLGHPTYPPDLLPGSGLV